MFHAALSPLRRHVFYIRPFQRNFLLPSSHGAQLSESVVPVFEVAADGALTPGTRTLGSLQHDSRVSFRDLLEIEQPPSSSSSSRIFPRAHSILFHLGPARGAFESGVRLTS